MATLTVRGQLVRSRSVRRYLVVLVRPKPVTIGDETYVAFARIERRTDSIGTARTVARRYGVSRTGYFAVVVDTTTGEEV